MTFVRYIPRPAGDSFSPLDLASFASLGRRLDSATDRAQAERDVVQQFEALFIQQLLGQARQATAAQPGMNGADMRLAQELNDMHMAQRLAARGLGLADAMLAQMGGQDAVRAAPIGPGPAHAAMPPPSTVRSGSAKAQMRSNDAIADLLGRIARAARVLPDGGVVSAIEGAPRHIRDFVATMGNAASRAARDAGLPTQLVLGQAALESGWGKREIRREDGSASHNLFGIKAGREWPGDVVQILTTEFAQGSPRKVRQAFRAYSSYEESFSDYANLISSNARYRQLREASSIEEAAHIVQSAGYATDPHYADKLIAVMRYFSVDHSRGMQR